MDTEDDLHAMTSMLPVERDREGDIVLNMLMMNG